MLEPHEKLKSELTPSSTHPRQPSRRRTPVGIQLRYLQHSQKCSLNSSQLHSAPCYGQQPTVPGNLSSGTHDQAVVLEQKHQPSKGWWKGCTMALPQCQELQWILLPCPVLPSRPAVQRVTMCPTNSPHHNVLPACTKNGCHIPWVRGFTLLPTPHQIPFNIIHGLCSTCCLCSSLHTALLAPSSIKSQTHLISFPSALLSSLRWHLADCLPLCQAVHLMDFFPWETVFQKSHLLHLTTQSWNKVLL